MEQKVKMFTYGFAIWAAYSIFFVGIASSIAFYRVNFGGESLKVDFPDTPVIRRKG